MATRVTIGGLPVTYTGVAWTNPAGVRHGQNDFEVPTADLELYLALRGKPVSLIIQPDTSASQPIPTEYNNLFILFGMPGDRPAMSKIRVVDRRYWWPRTHIGKSFNMRRRTGYWRVNNISNQPLETQPISELFNFWEWSLNNGELFSAFTMIGFLFKVYNLEQAEAGLGTPPLKVDLSAAAVSVDKASVENVEIDTSFDNALMQVMKYLPDAKIVLSNSGLVEISPRNGFEDELVNAAVAPEKYGLGHTEVVDMSALMPAWVDVLFTPEMEVLFRFDTNIFPAVLPDGRGSFDGRRRLDNVIPNPAWTLTVNNKQLVEGSIILFDEFLDAIPIPPNGSRRIASRDLQEMMVPFLSLWARVLGKYSITADPSFDWNSAISAMQQHYRQTYRIAPHFVDRCRSIRNYRAATVDPARGLRAKSSVYADYCAIPGVKGFERFRAAGGDSPYFINCDGYSANIDSTTRPAPVEVDLLDADQGLIHFRFKPDVLRNCEMVLPSKLKPSVGVFGDISQIAAANAPGQPNSVRLFAWNQIFGNKVLSLVNDDDETISGTVVPGHKVAVILTCIPAGTNDANHFYRLRINPLDVADMLPLNMRRSLLNASGPPYQARVGPGIETARGRWHEQSAAKIEGMFGLANGQPAQTVIPTSIDELIVNRGPQAAIGRSAASLDAIAKAYAARIFGMFGSRFMGKKTGSLSPSAVPYGWVDSVTHSVSSTGEASTSIQFPDVLPQLDFLALLPADTRAVILREVYKRS